MMKRFKKPKKESTDISTRYLYVSGAGDSLGSDKLEMLFRSISTIDYEGIVIIPDKRYCFVIYKTIESAQKAMMLLGDRPIEEYDNIRLYIKYAEEDDSITNTTTTGTIIEPEDCSNTDNINVPGFYLFHDFIDDKTEEMLYDHFSKEGTTTAIITTTTTTTTAATTTTTTTTTTSTTTTTTSTTITTIIIIIIIIRLPMGTNT